MPEPFVELRVRSPQPTGESGNAPALSFFSRKYLGEIIELWLRVAGRGNASYVISFKESINRTRSLNPDNLSGFFRNDLHVMETIRLSTRCQPLNAEK